MRVKIIIMLNWTETRKCLKDWLEVNALLAYFQKNCPYIPANVSFIQLKFFPSILVFIVCLESRMISLKVWSPTDWRFVPPQSKPVTVNLLNYFLTIDSLSWRKFVLLSLNTEEVASDSKIFSSLNYFVFENGEKFNMQSYVWRNSAKSINKEVSITILTKLWVQLNVDHNHI